MFVFLPDTSYARALHLGEKEVYASLMEEGPSFHFGDVTFDEFSREYAIVERAEVFGRMVKEDSSEDSFCRKIVALPMAVWTAVSETVYKIAEMAAMVFLGDRSVDACDFYSLVRTAQKVIGYVVQIFHDEWGSYLIQEAEFQQRVYELYHRTQDFLSGPPSYTTAIDKRFHEKYSALIDFQGLCRDISDEDLQTYYHCFPSYNFLNKEQLALLDPNKIHHGRREGMLSGQQKLHGVKIGNDI